MHCNFSADEVGSRRISSIQTEELSRKAEWNGGRLEHGDRIAKMAGFDFPRKTTGMG